MGTTPQTPAASYRNIIMFLLPLHVRVTKSTSLKHLLYYEELKGHFIIENMKSNYNFLEHPPDVNLTRKGSLFGGQGYIFVVCVITTEQQS